jgi:hypothetical protein
VVNFYINIYVYLFGISEEVTTRIQGREKLKQAPLQNKRQMATPVILPTALIEG